MDRRTEKALFEERGHIRELQEKKEKRFWRNVDTSCSLSEAVEGLTKDEMDKIRKNLSLKGLSSLTKADLAAELVKVIPAKFETLLYSLDQERYELIKAVATNSGSLDNVDISMKQASALMGYGLVFAGMKQGKKVLFLPSELVDLFVRADGDKLEKTVERNTQWLRLTSGMIYYYGVMDVELITEKISELTGGYVNLSEFLEVILHAFGYYGEMRYSQYSIYDHRVADPGKIVDEQKTRSDLNYYPFTKEEFLKAGEPGYIDRTPAMDKFINLLLKYYKLKDEETNEIAWQLIKSINQGAKPEELLQYLQTQVEIPSFDFAQLLTAEIMNLYNNTRQWALKGYTPNELSQKNKKPLTPLGTPPSTAPQKESNVIDLKTRKKIGRNELCPCGSMKKYKKCCGK
ncbi:YecA family protein [Dethiobacter alkaliphilus]|uniref:YecA family protein n=1 Tax=Dethiobacter alkaliphilus TaxID=427926 RepID=UPI0022275EC0|nr:SEC-C metal-binding domain-containing protein [Dethiobacter alkaliphilus]MCW3490675.1 SEC-C metal-binding domain-containing protein [Dethiobacter alkaliphilus]